MSETPKVKCYRCHCNRFESDFFDAYGKPTKTCQKCRDKVKLARASWASQLRRCAGVDGNKCRNMITDYRCPDCWAIIRGYVPGIYAARLITFTGDEYGMEIDCTYWG